jgi:orotidine-5'-phosphate decarboxylase
MGHCGYSSLGAVVGATYPQEAVELRKRMPSNMFLIPGMGAQGGTAKDAVAGFSAQKSAALINVSRGLLAQFGPEVSTPESLKAAICARAQKFNAEVAAALLEAIS